MKEGRLVQNFFTREGLIYQEVKDGDDESSRKKSDRKVKKPAETDDEELKIHVLIAKKTTLKQRLQCQDAYFLDFVRWLLEIDPLRRPTAKEALQHPWLTEQVYKLD